MIFPGVMSHDDDSEKTTIYIAESSIGDRAAAVSEVCGRQLRLASELSRSLLSVCFERFAK